MEKLASFIVNHRKKIGIVFVVLILASILLIPNTNVNYDLSKYIPDTFKAKDGLNVTEEEFGMQSIARLMINNVSIIEVKEYKEKIENIEGINMVLWLDDEYDVYQPETFMDNEIVEKYYKDGSGIFDIMFEEDDYSVKTREAINQIIKIIPSDYNMMGSALDMKSAQDNINSEIAVIMLMLVPLTIVILLSTTKSWISPLLFISVIATSIILNMGSNVFLNSVSFLTYSISAALQFAVSMDYSVFMLHQFEIEKKNKVSIEEAMKKALKNSIVPILSSSMTTIAGFLALAGMNFKIGLDIGIVFSKGIVFSLICVIFLMPYLIIRFNRLIEKTEHKSFLPTFEKVGKITKKIRWVVVLLVIILVVPSYVAQNENEFQYGVGAFGGGEGTRAYNDEQAIVDKFGRSNPIVILVPNENYISEKELIKEIENIDTVIKVQSLANTVPEGVPYSFVDNDLYSKFQTENYTRILVYVKTKNESDLATQTEKQIEQLAQKYYQNRYKITGTIPITIDMKDSIEDDYSKVNLISILAIAIILIITFKNIALSIILILVIEAGIFINMAIPYYLGSTLIFMGYLIVSSIELGATIDYAILVTNNYLESRKSMKKDDAMINTIMKSTPAILTSGGILILAGYLIKFFSSLTAVSEMGELIGRGALISVFLVIFILPQLLVIFDKIIHFSIIPKRLREKIQNKKEEKIEKLKNSKAYKKQIELLENRKNRLKIREQKKKIKAKDKINKKILKLQKTIDEIERGEK